MASKPELLHNQAAKGAIAKDLGIMRCEVRILKIMEIHNHLIVE